MADGQFLPQLETLLKAPIRQELSFSNGEYANRLQRVLEDMERLHLDVYVTGNNANICYLAGFEYLIMDYANFLLIRKDGHGAMVVAGTEVNTVLLFGWIRDVRDFPSWSPTEASKLVAKYIEDWALADARIGIDQAFEVFDPQGYVNLRQALSGATFVDASELVTNLRSTKSPAEIAHLRKAAHYGDIGILAAASAVQRCATENEVAAVASNAMIRAGSEYFSTAPFVASGVRTGLPHAPFGRNKISESDPVVLELAGAYQRYAAPIARTIVPAKSPSEFKRLAQISLECLKNLLSEIKPGRQIGEVAKSVRSSLQTTNLNIVPLLSFGTSIGIGLCPSWKEDWLQIHDANTRHFETGMAFYSPIRLCVPGEFGACIGESWIVTGDGVERLSYHPMQQVLQ